MAAANLSGVSVADTVAYATKLSLSPKRNRFIAVTRMNLMSNQAFDNPYVLMHRVFAHTDVVGRERLVERHHLNLLRDYSCDFQLPYDLWSHVASFILGGGSAPSSCLDSSASISEGEASSLDSCEAFSESEATSDEAQVVIMT